MRQMAVHTRRTYTAQAASQPTSTPKRTPMSADVAAPTAAPAASARPTCARAETWRPFVDTGEGSSADGVAPAAGSDIGSDA
jgi:hypothetical protein